MTNRPRKKLVLAEKSPVAIVYRTDTPASFSLAQTLAKWLKVRDYEVATAPEQKRVPGTKLLKTSNELGKMGLIVVLGGDGTYLRAVRLLKGHPVPILGVNLGSLGFLTPARSDEVFTVVEHTLQHKMEMRPRTMLKMTWLRKGKKKLDLLALNDVVLERGSFSQLINMQIKADDQLVKELKADGIIVSSPTGSTAYNLAAGGPILYPEVRAMVLTPIASHSLTSRPIIFPDDKEISLKLLGKNIMAHLVVDGQKVAEVSSGDEILVTRNGTDHFLVKDPKHNYFNLLREKLKFGDRN